MGGVLDGSGGPCDEDTLRRILDREGPGRVYWELAHMFPYASDPFIEYIGRSADCGCGRARRTLETAVEQRKRLG